MTVREWNILDGEQIEGREGGGHSTYRYQIANEEDVGNIENRKIKLPTIVGDASPIPE